jgi:hypothetical protein
MLLSCKPYAIPHQRIPRCSGAPAGLTIESHGAPPGMVPRAESILCTLLQDADL